MDGLAPRAQHGWMPHPTILRRGVLAVAMTCSLAPAAPASAATWQAPEEAPLVVDTRPRFDAAGTAYLLDYTGHKLALRPSGGPVQAPIDLVPAEPRPLEARFGVSAAGEVAAIYTRFPAVGRKVHKRVRVVFRSPGGTVSAPRTVSTPGRTAETPQIAVAPGGGAIAAWIRHEGGGVWRLQIAGRAAGQPFSAPRTVTGEVPRRSRIVVAIREDGSGVVVVNKAERRSRMRTLVSVPVGADGAIGDAQEIDTAKAGGAYGADGMAVRTATGADGTIALLFLRDTERLFGAHLFIATARPGSGRFGEARRVATSGGPVIGWDVGVDGRGHAVPLWASYERVGADTDDRIKARVWTAVQQADGSFSARVGVSDPAKTVSSEGSIFDTSIGIDVLPDGRAVAVWSALDGWRDFTGVIAAAVRSADGTWSREQYLTAPEARSYIPRLALAPDGQVLVTSMTFPGPDAPRETYPLIAGRL